MCADFLGGVQRVSLWERSPHAFPGELPRAGIETLTTEKFNITAYGIENLDLA